MDEFIGTKPMRLDQHTADLAGPEIMDMLKGRTNAQYSRTTFHVDYINLTDKTMYLKNRMGLVEVITPEVFNHDIRVHSPLTASRRGIIVRVSLSVTIDSAEATLQSLQAHRDKSTLSNVLYVKTKAALNSIMRMRKNRSVFSPGRDAAEVEVHYFIHEQTLKGQDKYFSELDVTIALADRGEVVAEVDHPNTQDKIVGGAEVGVQYWSTDNSRGDKRLCLNMAIVDQTGVNTVGEHYIHFLGKVYSLPIIRKAPTDTHHGVRFEVERNQSSLSATGEKTLELQTLVYNFLDVKDEFGIKKSVEETHDAMDPRRKIEREKERFEMESHNRKMEIELAKDIHLRSRHEFEIAKSKIEIEQFDIKTVIEKHRLDTTMVKARSDQAAATATQLASVIAIATGMCTLALWVYNKFVKVGDGGNFADVLSMPKLSY